MQLDAGATTVEALEADVEASRVILVGMVGQSAIGKGDRREGEGR